MSHGSGDVSLIPVAGAARAEGTAEDGGSGLRRHAVALLGILLLIVPVVGTRSAFVTDESFMVIQLQTIEETGRWELQHPLPEIDPTGVGFPLHGASRNEAGYTLFGKHPLLVYLYLPVYRAAGLVGLVGLSVLGTWCAAIVAASLAERIQRRSGVAALWLVGLGSPLFFDAYLIHAHTIAAATAGLAVLSAARLLDRASPTAAVLTVSSALVTAMLRGEGVLFALALGAVLVGVGALRRHLAAALLGVVGGGAGIAAYLGDRWWSTVVAAGVPDPVGLGSSTGISFFEGRRTSLRYTFLMPGYRGTPEEALALIGAALLVLGVVIARRRPADVAARALPVVGAAMLLVRPLFGWGAIPGLLIAFVGGIVGLCLLHGRTGWSPDLRVALAVGGLFCLGVALTQYPFGGHTEWGGRYFALAIPVLGAAAAVGLVGAVRELPRSTAVPLVGSVVVALLGLGCLSITTLRGSHDHNRARSDGVLAVAQEMPVMPGALPVVLTEDEQVPRLARDRYDEARWLLVTSRTVATYLSRLADRGVDDVLVVSVDPPQTLAEVPPAFEQVGEVVPHDLQHGPGGGLIRLHRRAAQ